MHQRLIRSLQRGLTLLEITIALALLAVLGTLAVPSLGARLDQQRLYSAAEAMVADVNEARFEAARQGRALHLVMQAGDNWCWAVATQENCPCGQALACELRSAQQRDHAGVRLVAGQTMHLGANGRADCGWTCSCWAGRVSARSAVLQPGTPRADHAVGRPYTCMFMMSL